MEYVRKLYNNKVKFEDTVGGGPPLLAQKRPAQNIVQRLESRELFNGSRVGSEKYLQRSMCQSIFPNFTITGVEKPPCFLRKFTPDGQYLLAFAPDYASVDIFTFHGPQAPMKLLMGQDDEEPDSKSLDFDLNDDAWDSETSMQPPPKKRGRFTVQQKKPLWTTQIGPEHTDDLSEQIRCRIFDTLFSFKKRIRVAPTGEQLNRECSLFTEDSRYLIVCSANYIHDEHQHPTFQEIYRNNDSIEPNSKYPLEDYTIHVVDLVTGVNKDSIRFPVDKIYMSHNQGIYLFKQTLAILSVQHQTIHIYLVVDGEFRHMRNIGRFCYEDDYLVLQRFKAFRPNRSFEDKNINVLKQRILAFLHKVAYRQFVQDKDPSKLLQFHHHFSQLEGMRIWKMQLLDEDHLLLKYSSPEVVNMKILEPNTHYCLFVFYCISTTEVLAVHDSNSEELVGLYESFTENFRNNFLTQEARYCPSPSNNLFAMQLHQNFRKTITSARFGGPAEAAKRILTQLPISAQSYSSSPYLDQSLFSYDDHRVSIMERPKASGEQPIRFYGRDSGLFKYEMFAGIAQRVPPGQSSRRLVAFTFHPSAPFAISVQRANSEYLVNFHVRLDTALRRSTDRS